MVKTGEARRIGVMGSSFDPVHLGHLIAAQDAAEQMALEQVLFMPASRTPLKRAEETLSGEQRAALLAAAIEKFPQFVLSRMELDRAGTSYTIDTARALRREFPKERLFWIIGADQAAQIDQWRDIETLATLVEFIVLPRPGVPETKPSGPAALQLHRIKSHAFEISSSEVRERIARGLSVRLFLPDAVADAIEREGLYRCPASM